MRAMVWCPVCERAFADVDDSGVCPLGHETRDLDDEYPVGEVCI